MPYNRIAYQIVPSTEYPGKVNVQRDHNVDPMPYERRDAENLIAREQAYFDRMARKARNVFRAAREARRKASCPECERSNGPHYSGTCDH